MCESFTEGDKRRAVETLLRDEEWAKLSDRTIASTCGVSHDFVNRLHRELSFDDSSTPSEPVKRMGRDGKMRPATQPKRDPQIAPVVAEVIDDVGDERPHAFRCGRK